MPSVSDSDSADDDFASASSSLRRAATAWPKNALRPEDIHWVVLKDGTHVLGLRCRSKKEKLPPWQWAKQSFVSHHYQMHQVKEDKSLKGELKEWKARQGLDGVASLRCIRVSGVPGLRAFGVASNQLGCERSAVLALALTASLDRPGKEGKQMTKLLAQVKMTMSRRPAVESSLDQEDECEASQSVNRHASASSSSRPGLQLPIGMAPRFKTVRKWQRKKKQQETTRAQDRMVPVVLRSKASMCKKRPKPPSYPLMERVPAKAMPLKSPKERVPAKAMPLKSPKAQAIPAKAMPPTRIALAAASSKAAPAVKAAMDLKDEVKSEVKEESEPELEEVKIEAISSDDMSQSDGEQRLVRTPRVQNFLRQAQSVRDWDPASRQFDRERYGEYIQMIDCERLRWSHRSIADTFRNGPHRGQPVQTLTNDLVGGHVCVDDVPALVGVEESNEVWVVSGNRRLFAFREFAKIMRNEGNGDVVRVPALVFSSHDMSNFPQSLFARCLEAFSGEGGGPPTLRSMPLPVQPLPCVVPPRRLVQPAPVQPMAPGPPPRAPALRGSILKEMASKSIQGVWADQNGAIYTVVQTQVGGMQVVKNQQGNQKTHGVRWDDWQQCFTWRGKDKVYCAHPENKDTIHWSSQGFTFYTWRRCRDSRT